MLSVGALFGEGEDRTPALICPGSEIEVTDTSDRWLPQGQLKGLLLFFFFLHIRGTEVHCTVETSEEKSEWLVLFCNVVCCCYFVIAFTYIIYRTSLFSEI